MAVPLMRLLFGMDRLPRSMSPDDARLPGVRLGPAALRLHSEPLRAEQLAAGQGGHAARMAAAEAWLIAACGSYAPLRQRFVSFWLQFAAAHVASHRTELQQRLAAYAGLYTPEDFVWSALRPLPRALLPVQDATVQVDAAFWDGTQIIAVQLGNVPDLAADNVVISRWSSSDMERDPELTVAERMPSGFLRFWESEPLPATPFRRPVPELGDMEPK